MSNLPELPPPEPPVHVGWSLFWLDIVTVFLFLACLVAAVRCTTGCEVPNIWT